MYGYIQKYLDSFTDSSPLVFFRISFGFLMFFSLVRFWYNGWIETVYLEPIFHFKYYGFGWISSLGSWIYLLFIIALISSLFIAIGYRYRLSIVVFFLSFTYIELIEKTTYLNHYYFISVISFILIFLPAHVSLSADCIRRKISYAKIPSWNIDVLKLLIFIVYLYAGLAKINTEWLIHAKPLSIWLPGKYDLPLIGSFMSKKWVHFIMSWCGMFFDVLIGFFLLSRKYRNIAFCFVIVFHLMTGLFFPSIGMFPYIMIFAASIFLDPKIHSKILKYFGGLISSVKLKEVDFFKKGRSKFVYFVLVAFISFQILFPFRYLFYNGELFWTEEGYRFSWRVMLVEKAGFCTFKILDNKTGRSFLIDNSDFLTDHQEKQMSFQADMILEYAHFLGDHYKKNGIANPSVYVDSYVALNGRLSERFISNDIDLLKEKDSFKSKKWILPFNDEITGF